MDDLVQVTAACGIDCFNCEFFHENIDQYFREMPAAKKELYDARGMTKDRLSCGGCRVTGCTAIVGECETLRCVKEKGVVFCYECDDFPCKRLQPMAEGASMYPHNLKMYNLMAIKRDGVEEWAKGAKQARERYFEGKFKIGAGPQNA